MSDRSAALAALADPVRQQLLDILSDQGPQTASQLAESFEISRQAVSKHLTQLETSELIHRSVEGRAVLFHADPVALRQTSEWLASTTSRWESRLDRLAAMFDHTE